MTSEFPPQHLLIVSGGGDLPDQARANWPGLRTTVICRPEVAPRLRSRERIQRTLVLREDAPVEEWVAAARFVHTVDPVDRVTNFSEKDVDKTAAIAEAFGMPWHTRETVTAVADKVLMRRRLAEAGVDDTVAEVVHDADDIRKLADRVGYPLICKPVRGVASQGVTRLDGPQDIERALDWGRQGADGLDSADLLVERFHQGTEYSVECLSENGEHLVACVTLKVSEHRHFVELGHVLPAPLTDPEHDRIAATVRATLDALGIREGVTHTEVLVTDDAVRIIETHLRPAGDEIPYLLKRARGIDLIDALARQSLGLPALGAARETLAAAQAGAPRYAAIWHACPDAVGTLVSVSGVEEARALDGVFDVDLYVEPGGELTGVSGSFARAAHVCAEGAGPHEALERARSAAQLLVFTVASAGVPARHGDPLPTATA